MRVLVTGGAGFIGSHLTRALLARGEQVVCLDDFNDYYAPARKRANVAPFLDQPGYTLVEGDICAPRTVDAVFARHQPERVAHLAAMPGVPPSVRDPARYAAVNVGGTVEILRAAAATGVRTVVCASSSTVYGATAPVPFREDDPADRPLAPYGASKRAAEMMAHAFHHLYGLNVVVPRFFNAYGPGQRPDQAAYIFVRAIHRGEPIHLRGNVQRDFTYIDDIVAGVLAALAFEGGYEIVNLGNSRPISMVELIAVSEDVVGRRAIVEQEPGLAADTPATCADVTKAHALLGYAPSITLREGLGRLYEWYRHEEEAGRA